MTRLTSFCTNDRILLKTVSFAQPLMKTQIKIILKVRIKNYLYRYPIKLNSFPRAQRIYQIKMKKSRSPNKDAAPVVDADPEASRKAKEAMLKRNAKKQSFFDKYSYHIVFGVFGAIMVFVLLQSLWKSGPNIHTTFVNDQAYIAERNSMGGSFQVGATSMFDNYKLVDVKYLINNQPTNKQSLYKCSTGNKDTIVPESYNFRQAHPDCAREIVRQGNCSSSYAVAAVGAIVDRWCKISPTDFPVLSPQAALACDKAINNNCKGGYISRTLDYSKIYGLTEQSCYPFSTTEVDTPQQCLEKTSKCPKHKIADYCVSSEQENIKQEIYNHGPVVTVIPVYRDFLIYKKGLYQVYPKNQKYSSGHAVKIIGWDVKQGKNCWVIENTWGEDWGEQGTACILTNQDELQIQRFTIAPALNSEQIENTVEADIETTNEKQGEATEQVEL